MGIRLKDLSKLGYRDNVARSLVVDIVGKYCKHDTKEQIAMTLSNILEHPESYKNNEIWSKLAERLSPTVLAKEFVAYDLREDPLMYKTHSKYPRKGVDESGKSIGIPDRQNNFKKHSLRN